MRGFVNRLICGGLVLCTCILPGLVRADVVSSVGAIGSLDNSLTVINANDQKKYRASGSMGANEAAAKILYDCDHNMKTAIDFASQRTAAAAAPGDPVKKFNDSIKDCLQNIQDISAILSFPSLNFTAMFEALLNKMIDKLINDVIMKICAAATNTWNGAVNNATNTLNTGINQAGLDTFGGFASVSPVPMSPAPFAAAPPAPASVKAQSVIPGL